MATLDFSRSATDDIEIKEDMLFNTVLDFTRSDSLTVDFTGKTIKMDISKKDGGTVIETLTSGAEITILIAGLYFNKTFTDLVVRSYYYELYNDTDKIGISYGLFIIK